MKNRIVDMTRCAPCGRKLAQNVRYAASVLNDLQEKHSSLDFKIKCRNSLSILNQTTRASGNNQGIVFKS